MNTFLEKTLCFVKKERYIIIFSFVIGLMVSIYMCYSSYNYAEDVQSGLAQNLIRFHVIANSDLEEDQSLKLKVRDKILDKMRGRLDKCESILETRKVILSSVDEIKKTAEQEIKKNNKDYPVQVVLGPSVFPTKQYGDVVLPTGEYEALKVIIGKGEGKNWWCVMFPPLCFVDITHSVISTKTKQQLRNVLTEEEYKVIMYKESKHKVPVKVKFKIVELWQSKKVAKHR